MDDPARLTEKEKQALRLLVRGHDAKSIARHLDLSVHTVNDRLRAARRKLGASSSREAARLLLAAESSQPEKLVPDKIGDALPRSDTQDAGRPRRGGRFRSALAAVIGVTAVILALSLLLPSPQAGQHSPDTAAATAIAAATVHPAEAEALRFLDLGDHGRWEESWRITGTEFRRLNTVAAWIAAPERARTPLGWVATRPFLSHEDVPAPLAGVEVVRFRTSLANKRDVTETVALAQGGGEWRVVGIYVG